jgi:hypothetical protein
MRILFSTSIMATFIMGSIISKTPRTSDPNKVYLTDTTGNLIDSMPYDVFGNTSIRVKKSGWYQIRLQKNDRIALNRRAYLNEGLVQLQIPVDEHSGRELNTKLYSVEGKRSLSAFPSTTGAAPTKMLRSVDYESSDMMVSPSSSMTETPGVERSTTISTRDKKEITKMKDRKEPSVKKATSGTLTAGLWNDLENWSRFKSTLESEKGSLGVWKMHLHDRRFPIELTDNNGKPAIDIAVQIRNSGGETIFWNSVTDNRGFAELWYAPFLENAPKVEGGFHLYAKFGERGWTKLGKVSESGDSRQSFRIQMVQELPSAVDIAFVVDATGSMGDEIDYLKEELMELMLRSSAFAPCSKIRLASVFYRDLGDEYVSKHAPFTDRYEDAVVYVQQQYAGGGGDFPEAVDAGLEEAMTQLTWSTKALSRICFLVLDAPPHDEKKKQMEALTLQYAAKGIKIIPIVASGINKPTEFLMKQMAALTSGDYIYITDDSGVGNSHLKPSGVESNVDLLILQMEKVIRKYTLNEACKEEEKPYQPDPKTLIFGDQQIQIQSYPNPATSFIEIHSNIKIEALGIYAINGQKIKEVHAVNDNKYRLDVRDISKGLYVLRVTTGQGVYSAKILILDAQRQD